MGSWFLSGCSVKWRLKWVSWKLHCHYGCLSHLTAMGLNIEAGAAGTYPQEVRMKADKARGTDV